MRYDLAQPPREVTATMWLVTTSGEKVQSKLVPVRITHSWYRNISRYVFDVLEEVSFTVTNRGDYMVMIMITDKDLGEFWVDVSGGSSYDMYWGESLVVSPTANKGGTSYEIPEKD